MATWLQENAVLTDIGLSMLSKAQAGLGKLCITKVVTRDTWDTVENNRKLTGDSSTVSNIKQEAVLLNPPAEGDAETPNGQNLGVTKIVARFSNEHITEKYYIKQVVVFMKLIDIDPNAPEGTDMGEVPYMVAQTENTDDSDIMPLFSENPTAINYDLYILHSGVAQINIAVKTAGYVDEDTFNEFKNYVINILAESVGQNTKDKTFGVWTPVYSDDDDPSGGRQWSKKTDDSGETVTTEYAGKKSAERFNLYADNANVATGEYSHVEGNNNVCIANAGHVEGVDNHSGADGNYGIHMEGRRNYATLGWFQHVEGDNNQSAGYTTHMEGYSNKAVNSGSESTGTLHVEGKWNTVKNGVTHHVEGEYNNIEDGFVNHVEGGYNTVKKGNYHHIGGNHNFISGDSNCNHVEGQSNKIQDCSEVNVSGRENIATNSNQASVSGYKNIVSNSERAIVAGTNNTVTNSKGTSISGESNSAIENCYESNISGYNNSIARSQHSSVSGINNKVADTSNSIVSGQDNTFKVSTLTTTAGNLALGNSNNATDTECTALLGASHTVSRSVNNLITGRNNTVSLEEGNNDQYVRESIIGGVTNNVQKTVRTLITGYGNTVSNYIPPIESAKGPESSDSIISGISNTVTGLFNSILTGKTNNITNIHNSFIGGYENTVTGTSIGDSAVNSVLCSGYKCTVHNNNSPQFVTGTSNDIKGANAAVFGSNNFATGNDQTVMGHYNVEDTANSYAVIVGGGTKNGENVARKNIFALDWEGNLHISALYTSDIYNPDGDQQLNAWNIADGTGDKSLVGNNITVNHATAAYSSAFGDQTNATGNYAFAAGFNTKAQGLNSTAFGYMNESTADYSFSVGMSNKAKGMSSAALGNSNSIDASSSNAVVTGANNKVVSAPQSFTTGNENTNSCQSSCVSGGYNSVSGVSDLVSGSQNTVTGCNYTIVSGTTNTVLGSHECIISGSGNRNIINCLNSFVIGSLISGTLVQDSALIGYNIAAEGDGNDGVKRTLAVGAQLNIRSSNSIISGELHYVAGKYNIVSGYNNVVGMAYSSGNTIQTNYGMYCAVNGSGNKCLGVDNSVQGYNLWDFSTESGTINGSDGYPTTTNPPTGVAKRAAFVGAYNNNTKDIIERNVFTVGIGTSDANRENGFSVAKDGNAYAKGTFNTGNADIAEWFEWEDKNLKHEDRRGRFVTLKGDKIVLADESTKYLFGIVSACPALVGNSYEDSWNEKYLKDVFGETIYEEYLVPAQTTKITNADGEEEEVVIVKEHFAKRPVLNPDYDPKQEYIPRSKRPEWSYVSSKGRLVMVDDGTCVVDGYCKPTDNGVATKASFNTTFRVMKRIDDTHILVWSDGAFTID